MSISSRARRVHRRLPWRKYQRIHDDLKRIRPDGEERYIADAITSDVSVMSFVEAVEAVRKLGALRREAELNSRRADLASDADDSGGEEEALRVVLVTLNDVTLMQLQTLYYFGNDVDDDPASLHAELATRTRDRDDAIETLLSKLPLDQALEHALDRLRQSSIDPNGAWHRVAPHDYVKHPPAWLRVRTPGSITARELAELLPPDRGTELLVAVSDPETGPYASCLRVAAADVEYWCQRGYRQLDFEEEFGEVEDFTRDWKHSE